MWTASHVATVVALLSCARGATSQGGKCRDVLEPSYASPVPGPGWTAQLIVKDLKSPRSIEFDPSGRLMVIESGEGIRRLTLADGGGTCLTVTESTLVVNNSNLNHGIAFSNDGKTLFASSSEEVLSWSYDAATGTAGNDQRVVVNNMSNTDHTTRTLLMSRKQPGMLVVSRGSSGNVDGLARDITSGHSQIRVFDTNHLPSTPYDFPSQGTMIGWGLRNSVGVAEEPVTGGIYSVENSVDQIDRDGTDIHENNPGEEMNFHGSLNSTQFRGKNYGYPDCFAVWDTDIPHANGLVVGDQFTPSPNNTFSDETCQADDVDPRLTLQAHMAPLDIIFTPNGSTAYVTFHGSWDRTNPTGYKLSSIKFANGSPVAPSDSTTSLADVLSNANNSACPDQCFRPVGVALDKQGRLFMSSDDSGEIYVLVHSDVSAQGGGGGGTTTGSPMSTATAAVPTTSTSGSVAMRVHGAVPRAFGGAEASGNWLLLITVLASFMTGLGSLPWLA